MTDTDSTTGPDLRAAAESIAPLIASKAVWSEDNGRLHPKVVDALSSEGILRMRIPLRYGGSEADAHTLMDVVATISAADGAAGWNTAVWSISSWLACLFPDEAQDEVFADPEVRVCGVLSPSAAATPTPGGMRITGRWHFISGALHSQWQVVLAMAPAPDGSEWPIMALVPLSDLGVDDDWDTSGLRGTGSVSTIAEDVFVPEHRVLPLPLVLQGRYASVANADSAVFTVPMIPSGSAGFIGAALGLARAARDDFFSALPHRKITYTAYESQQEAPITHFQVAEASLLLDEAEHHGKVVADLLDTLGSAHASWSVSDRVRTRVALGRVFDLTKRSVDVLRTGSGASSLDRTRPIQRIQRDLDALRQHALMHPNTNYELYGRILCGLEPNTMYV